MTKIEQTNIQQVIATRMTENFFDELGNKITGYAQYLSGERGTEEILQLFTYVAALKYTNTIPQTLNERQDLITDLSRRLEDFNRIGETPETINVAIGGYIGLTIDKVKQNEAIRQSKEAAENDNFFRELSVLIGLFAVEIQRGNKGTEITELKNFVRLMSKSKSLNLISTDQATKETLINQIQSKLIPLNIMGISTELIKRRVSELINMQLKVMKK